MPEEIIRNTSFSGDSKLQRSISSINQSINHFLLVFYSNYSAILRRNSIFQQMTLIWLFKVTKGQPYYAIRSAMYDFLLVFYSNYSAILYGNPFFQQMTLIWPFKVTKGQPDYAIWSATYDFLLVFYSSNYSAISCLLQRSCLLTASFRFLHMCKAWESSLTRPSLSLITLQDWSTRASTSCGRFDLSGSPWRSTLHTP